MLIEHKSSSLCNQEELNELTGNFKLLCLLLVVLSAAVDAVVDETEACRRGEGVDDVLEP